jgi:hypothetical protein
MWSPLKSEARIMDHRALEEARAKTRALYYRHVFSEEPNRAMHVHLNINVQNKETSCPCNQLERCHRRI